MGRKVGDWANTTRRFCFSVLPVFFYRLQEFIGNFWTRAGLVFFPLSENSFKILSCPFFSIVPFYEIRIDVIFTHRHASHISFAAQASPVPEGCPCLIACMPDWPRWGGRVTVIMNSPNPPQGKFSPGLYVFLSSNVDIYSDTGQFFLLFPFAFPLLFTSLEDRFLFGFFSPVQPVFIFLRLANPSKKKS